MQILRFLGLTILGALAAYITILGGLWYVFPFLLVAVFIVTLAIDKAAMRRVVAFGIGMMAVYAFEATTVVRQLIDLQHQTEVRLEQDRRNNAKSNQAPTANIR